ncbi:hypothetical protein LRAMOSA05012 [Lichtheimia ramosa]|uniref:DIS3-like exonuclease 2 n=1 Tax=Lichtheimia ramosa TaxID=688394 RepID=A0A077X0T4_9FUNG|nr:hypothetical protein LRAMOSA05012 [Lichtheimia ramosa]
MDTVPHEETAKKEVPTPDLGVNGSKAPSRRNKSSRRKSSLTMEDSTHNKDTPSKTQGSRNSTTRHKQKKSAPATKSKQREDNDSNAALNANTAPSGDVNDTEEKKKRSSRKKDKSDKQSSSQDTTADASINQPSASVSQKDTPKKKHRKRHSSKKDKNDLATTDEPESTSSNDLSHVQQQPASSTTGESAKPKQRKKKKKVKEAAPDASKQPEDSTVLSSNESSHVQQQSSSSTKPAKSKKKKAKETAPDAPKQPEDSLKSKEKEAVIDEKKSSNDSHRKKNRDKRAKKPDTRSSQRFSPTFINGPRRRLANGVEITVYPRGNGAWRQAKPVVDTPRFISNSTEDLDIHFANDVPTKTTQKIRSDTELDRVLSEVTIRLPKKNEKSSSANVDQSTSPPAYCHPDDRNPRKKRLMFNAYPSPESMQEEIQNGTLIRGIIRISKAHTSEAYVVPDTLDHDIFILGRRQRNRALEGDVVAVRLLDVDEIWERKKKEIRKKEEEKAKEKAAANEKDVEEDTLSENDEDEDEEHSNDEEEYDEDKNKPKYCGEVVGILDRAPHDAIAGILKVERPNANAPKANEDAKTKEPPRLVWFKPTDKRVPLIAIPFSSAPEDLLEKEEQYTSMIMTARILKWPIDAVHPFGTIVSTLGMVGSIVTESKAILADCGVKDVQFTNAVVRSLPKTPWKIPNKEYKYRRDLRSERIFTIDPATAKDLDDAVHVKKLDDGNFEVGVHIADVSFFVRERTALDAEARERGTSTYLVDRVIPMLPSLLCEELCSLNPGIERLAFSVIWKMDQTGVILDTWFGRSIIKSCAKLSYDDAQSVIEGKQLPETANVHEHPRNGVEQDILNLYSLSQHMRKRRFENGALSMNSVRLSFKLNEQGEPEDVWVYELKDANRLIEEFMLRANMSVAEKICGQFPNEALLRRHAPPIERRLDEFIKHSENLGYKLDGSSAGNLQASFNAIESQEVKDVLISLAIKPMQRAKYFCTGAMDISKYNHYALNVPLYTHFTSPIRRYADVIVHRQLNAALNNADSSGYDDQEAQQIALECNRNRDSAKNAQDLSSQLYLAHYLHNLQKSKGAIIRSAVVVQVFSEAVDIIVPEYGIEKRIHVDSLPVHQHKFNTNDMSLLLHWKKGVPVATHETENNAQVVSEDENESDNESCHGIPIAKASQVAHTPNQDLNYDQGTQLFKVFTKFDVLIQANVVKSPPIINVYLVNPFATIPST